MSIQNKLNNGAEKITDSSNSTPEVSKTTGSAPEVPGSENSTNRNDNNRNQFPFYIHDQYIKDLSFENPNFLIKYSDKTPKPDISVNVESHVSKLNDDTYEVILKVKVNSTAEKQTVFLIDLSYGALVSVDKNQPADVLEPVLLVHSPFLMFPFVRSIVADMTRYGGYPPLLLEPIDFATLYMKKKRELAQQNNKTTENPTDTQDKKTTVN